MNLTDANTDSPPVAIPNDIATIVASIVDEKLANFINTLTINANKSHAETLALHNNLRVTNKELLDNNCETIQVKLDDLSA